MIERSVELTNRQGLHARPISQILAIAQDHEASLRVACGDREADGRSIFDLMTLSAGPGKTLTFRAEGADAAGLVEKLVTLVEGRFGED